MPREGREHPPDCVAGKQGGPEFVPDGLQDLVSAALQCLEGCVEDADGDGSPYCLVNQHLGQHGL